MALLWLDSFDDRTSAYGAKYDDSVNSAGMVAWSGGRTGDGLSLVSSVDQSLTKTFSAKTTFIIGMAIRMHNVDVTTIPFLEILDGATVQAYLQVNASNQVQVVRGDGTVLATSANSLSSSITAQLEFKVTPHNSAGSYSLRFNEVLDLSATGVNTRNSSNNSATSVRLFCEVGSSNYIEVDDFYICDATGSTNNDFLGTLKIQCLRPTAAGNTTAWTPVIATNWSNVDDPDPDDDTSYVAATAVGTKDTYTFADLHTSASGATITGVLLSLVAEKDDLLVRKIVPVVRSGGSDYDGSAITLTGSYVHSTQLYETNPATSVAWTYAGVNAAQFGVKVDT